jgi:hypothetical protein
MHDPAILMVLISVILGGIVLLSVRARNRKFAPRESTRSAPLSAIVRSLIAALAGLAMGVLWYGFYLLVFNKPVPDEIAAFGKPSTHAVARDLLFHAYASGLFVTLVWLFVLLPVAFRIPRTSSLWRLPTSTAVGGSVGVLVMVLFSLIIGGVTGPFALWFFVVEAGIIGAVTSLLGSLLLNHRKGES